MYVENLALPYSTSNINMGASGNIVCTSSGTGTQIATAANQKLAFHGVAPGTQHSSTGETVGFTAGSGTSANDDSSYTGNVGSLSYTVADIVKALKNKGILAQ